MALATNELMVKEENDLMLWSSDVSLKEIKEIYGKGLTDGEFKQLVQIGKRCQLNPFLREIWAYKYGTGAATIFVGRDGYRRNAQRHPMYDYHRVDAVYENDDFGVIDGDVKHRYQLKNRGELLGAYCVVKRKNSSKPYFVFVDFKEYSTNKSLWTKEGKPATMIKKVAESQALRMAFQEMFAGTYDSSEAWKQAQEAQPINDTKLKEDNGNIIEGETITHHGMDLEDVLLKISQVDSEQELRQIFTEAYRYFKSNNDEFSLNLLITKKDKKLAEIKKVVEEFKNEMEEEVEESHE